MAIKKATTAGRNGRGFTLEGARRISQETREPRWAQDARLKAWETYEAAPMPDSGTEGWRRTDLSGLRLQEMALARQGMGRLSATKSLPRLGEQAGGLVTFDHAELIDQWLDPALAGEGVIFTSLVRALQEHPDLVRRYLEPYVTPSGDGKLDALNAAFWGAGTFLYVPDGVAVSLPLEARFGASRAGLAAVGRSIIVLGAGAKLLYRETLGSRRHLGQALHSAASQFHLGEGASLRYLALQTWGEGVYSFSRQRFNLGKDASLDLLDVALGGRLTRGTLEIALNGAGSRAQAFGLCLGDGEQQFDYITAQHHLAPNTASDLVFKAALKDKGSSLFTGLVKVDKAAQRTDAFLTSRSLLLGQSARADSVPVLEIEANDVRCSHAAAIGPVDEEQAFYLTSRGLSPEEAERLVVLGFFEDVLERAGFPESRQAIRRMVQRKLENGRTSPRAALRA